MHTYSIYTRTCQSQFHFTNGQPHALPLYSYMTRDPLRSTPFCGGQTAVKLYTRPHHSTIRTLTILYRGSLNFYLSLMYSVHCTLCIIYNELFRFNSIDQVIVYLINVSSVLYQKK